METWKQYQEDAAAHFRSVGLSAEVDVRLRGSRTVHDIDVAVIFDRAGLEHLWIVECKAHNRPISKDRALVLRQIVHDIGADKGILLCELGFQAGAREAVSLTNTAVMSLAELRANADVEIFEFAIEGLRRRTSRALKSLRSLSTVTRTSHGGRSSLPVLPSGGMITDPLELLGRLSILESGITTAGERDFPSVYAVGPDDEVLRADRADFVLLATRELERFESVVAVARRASPRT